MRNLRRPVQAVHLLATALLFWFGASPALGSLQVVGLSHGSERSLATRRPRGWVQRDGMGQDGVAAVLRSQRCCTVLTVSLHGVGGIAVPTPWHGVPLWALGSSGINPGGDCSIVCSLPGFQVLLFPMETQGAGLSVSVFLLLRLTLGRGN